MESQLIDEKGCKKAKKTYWIQLVGRWILLFF